MEIRVLRYFVTVAREENITKAAEKLHITQPTLSRQLHSEKNSLNVATMISNLQRTDTYSESMQKKFLTLLKKQNPKCYRKIMIFREISI